MISNPGLNWVVSYVVGSVVVRKKIADNLFCFFPFLLITIEKSGVVSRRSIRIDLNWIVKRTKNSICQNLSQYKL